MAKFLRNKSKPRTVVGQILRSKDKPKILQNAQKLKDTGILFMKISLKQP